MRTACLAAGDDHSVGDLNAGDPARVALQVETSLQLTYRWVGKSHRNQIIELTQQYK